MYMHISGTGSLAAAPTNAQRRPHPFCITLSLSLTHTRADTLLRSHSPCPTLVLSISHTLCITPSHLRDACACMTNDGLGSGLGRGWQSRMPEVLRLCTKEEPRTASARYNNMLNARSATLVHRNWPVDRRESELVAQIARSISLVRKE